MRNLLALIGFVAVIGLVAAFTKPSEARVEAKLKEVFLTELASRNPSQAGSGGAFAATLLCKADQDACFDLLRAALRVTYEDRSVYARVDIKGLEQDMTCYGVFTQFLCQGNLIQ